jgi:pyrroloquinoline quinone biosynthesis protein B
MKRIVRILPVLLLVGCNEAPTVELPEPDTSDQPFLIVLGNVQDAGSPQAGCEKDCCKDLFETPDPYRRVVALGLVDPASKTKYLFEATPDLPQQIEGLYRSSELNGMVDGIFLTHAHIGHYSGLMYLGKESMFSKGVPVYTMPRMKAFLENNGPWDQLVKNQNIDLSELKEDSLVSLSNAISVQPILVPHRDEYSETVGFVINGPDKKALFIPDIDKWSKWDRNIVELIKEMDYALIDGTFYDGDELPGRDINEVPHPFIQESCELFDGLPIEERNKIYFIHFNHTNPLLDPYSSQSRSIEQKGYNVARLNQKLNL